MVRKAVVLVGGLGKRLRPLTRAVPKEILRVGKKPVIEHVLNLLRQGGIEEVLIVLGSKSQPIIDYVGSGESFNIDIYYRVQEEVKGSADAVSLAESFVKGEEKFVVVYGDNYLRPYTMMESLVDFHKEKEGSGALALHPVEDPRRYGIVRLDGSDRVIDIKEKPSLEKAQSFKRDNHWLNIAGLMILDWNIFKYIEEIEPDERGELCLTDAVDRMKDEKEDLYGFIIDGKRYDVGTFKSLVEANKVEEANLDLETDLGDGFK